MRCPECEAIIKPGMSTCPNCGIKLPKTISCPECGKDIFETWNVCPYCGKKIKQSDSSNVSNPNKSKQNLANEIKRIAQEMKEEVPSSKCPYSYIKTGFVRRRWACGRDYNKLDRCKEGVRELKTCTTWLTLNYYELLPVLPPLQLTELEKNLVKKYGEATNIIIAMKKLDLIEIYICEVVFFNF